MADNTTKRGQPDRSKINMKEDYEVKYWAKFGAFERLEGALAFLLGAFVILANAPQGGAFRDSSGQ
jgi:Protein of unknown function (DUF3606)